MHVEKQNFPCGKCSHQFRNRSSIDNHTLGHQKPMSYSCTYRKKLCKIKQPLMEHIQSIHVEKYKLSCKECRRAIKYIKGLDKHKVQTVVQDAPKEQCTLEPQRTCKHVTKMVPKLEPTEECVNVPKEVCTRSRTNPRKVKKPVVKKWCYVPSEESGLA